MLQAGTKIPYEVEVLVTKAVMSTYPSEAGDTAHHAALIGASIAWAQKRSAWPVVVARVTWLGFVAFMFYMVWGR